MVTCAGTQPLRPNGRQCRINSLQLYEVTYIFFSLGQDIQYVHSDRHYLRGISPSILTLQYRHLTCVDVLRC